MEVTIKQILFFCSQVLTCDKCVLYVVSNQIFIKLAILFDFQIPNLAFALLNF